MELDLIGGMEADVDMGKMEMDGLQVVAQVIQYTENNGNPFSDVLWLAALVQSESELEFGQQRFCLILISCGSIGFFDHVSPDYHGIHEPVMLIVFKAVFGTILDTDLS
ncbi:hypothetical protein L2E82_16790 [Cichorium intybus]|uniref:Uncharacterized protein n=1 Tax=Cichorium intybus TaxID=13427 RepID=A0ACB9F714_CICIN|nr:hypothetical protein L2E82_16790 [Cichorium intybus]